ncbi:hypothetical protein GOV04_04120 [Candidatus Woesearchaeota archaeon]|nr:hypothetical protein [Candidatus Woesearchaeota archaeon]
MLTLDEHIKAIRFRIACGQDPYAETSDREPIILELPRYHYAVPIKHPSSSMLLTRIYDFIGDNLALPIVETLQGTILAPCSDIESREVFYNPQPKREQ